MKRNMPKVLNRNKRKLSLLAEFPVNTHFQIGVYEGTLSQFDLLIQYRQFLNGEWTKIRRPRHINWAVDILIKQTTDPEASGRFLSFLLDYWDTVLPIKTEEDRKLALSTERLLDDVESEANNYPELAGKGEYSVKFLIVLARLLMLQEKTNKENAYMFKTLLEQLKEHKDIFKIVSTATHTAKKRK